MKAAFEMARKWKYITSNPVTDLKKVKIKSNGNEKLFTYNDDYMNRKFKRYLKKVEIKNPLQQSKLQEVSKVELRGVEPLTS